MYMNNYSIIIIVNMPSCIRNADWIDEIQINPEFSDEYYGYNEWLLKVLYYIYIYIFFFKNNYINESLLIFLLYFVLY